jgi:tRNA(Arg) A34 adenosine deaminase TadA
MASRAEIVPVERRASRGAADNSDVFGDALLAHFQSLATSLGRPCYHPTNATRWAAMIDDEKFLRLAIDVARRARASGNHPFGAILVGPDGAVLMEAGNAHGDAGDRTGHAERVLMTRASLSYAADFLASCTLYASAEPCAMCAGAAYWAGVGRVVYGLSEHEMRDIIGPHPENLTMDLPCRTVFAAGQRAVEVVGPLLEDEARSVHDGFWS